MQTELSRSVITLLRSDALDMRVLCVFGEHSYGRPDRGQGLDYPGFAPALRQLGHEVLFLESWNRTCYSGFRELNEALLRTVERHRPDVVLAVLIHYEIWLDCWEILRDSGLTATVNWTTDDSWKYDQFSRLVAPAFHAFTTTYPNVFLRYQRDGILNVLLTQWAANAGNLQPPLPAAQCEYKVSFVGAAHGKRKAWVEALRNRGIEVACFGHGWQRGPLASTDVLQVIRNSIISLNFANGALAWNGVLPSRTNQIKARTFEVPGAGGFLLSQWAEGLDQYYVPGQEIAVFRDIEEAARLIRYYLAHPDERDAVAWAGYRRTCAEHTYDQRLAGVLDFALKQRDCYFARAGKSPTGVIDWARFADVAERHKPTPALKLLRWLLVTACSAVWGRTRGPRAARRLVFEISWRLAGAHTYSASGWPGRLFYEAS